MSRTCRSLRSWGIPQLTLCVVSCLVAAANAPITWGQQDPTGYTWEAADAAYDQRFVVAQRVLKNQVLYGQQGFAANRAAIENWYRQYLFPSMATESELGSLRDRREELSKDLESVTDPNLYQVLVDLVYEEATKRVLGNYHPAVRHNAILIVGDLNQVGSRREGTELYPPIRLPRALDFLVDELAKPDQLDVLRVGAMLGIERHLRLVQQRPQDQPIPDARKAEIAALVKTLVDQKEPPEGRTRDVHTWLRRGAVDVLAAIGAVGPGNATFNTVAAIVRDADEPLSLRCTAARALGSLNYADTTGIDALATARDLAALAAYACRQEDDRVREEFEKLDKTAPRATARGGMPGTGGMMPGMMPGMGGTMPGMMPGTGGTSEGGGMMPGMMPGMGGTMPGMMPGMGQLPGLGGLSATAAATDDLEDTIDHVRRRLKLPLLCVLLGLRGDQRRLPGGQQPAAAGVGQLATDETQQTELRGILSALNAVVKATDQFENGLQDMMKAVRDRTRDLETLLPKAAAPEPAEDADDDLPGGALPGGAKPAAEKS